MLWEKEKLLVMSNFSFSYSVFNPFEELSSIFIKFENVVCNIFQFGRVVWERVNCPKVSDIALQILDSTRQKAFAENVVQTMIFALDKVKTLWDKEKMFITILKFVLRRVENILGKGPFPKVFSKASFLMVIRSLDCVVKI